MNYWLIVGYPLVGVIVGLWARRELLKGAAKRREIGAADRAASWVISAMLGILWPAGLLMLGIAVLAVSLDERGRRS